MTFVQRLKKLWKVHGPRHSVAAIVTAPNVSVPLSDTQSLPSKYANMWRDVQKVMTPRQNYAAYREVLKTATTPMFPYFGG